MSTNPAFAELSATDESRFRLAGARFIVGSIVGLSSSGGRRPAPGARSGQQLRRRIARTLDVGALFGSGPVGPGKVALMVCPLRRSGTSHRRTAGALRIFPHTSGRPHNRPARRHGGGQIPSPSSGTGTICSTNTAPAECPAATVCWTAMSSTNGGTAAVTSTFTICSEASPTSSTPARPSPGRTRPCAAAPVPLW